MNLISYVESAAAVALTFGMVVFLHESGHFFLCRWLGVRVERFAFGFGPELFGVTSKGTRFSICAFPLGGFVRPAGEELESCTGAPDEYFAQSWKKRLAIVAAGPVMNYLLAFLLFAGVVYIKGMPETATMARIGNMMTGYPADSAGIEIGDLVTAVNGAAVSSWDELANTIHKYPDQPITLTYERQGKSATLTLTPKKDNATGNGVIGILPDTIYHPVGLIASIKEGVKQCWRVTDMTASTIASKIWHRQRPDLAGPIGIVQMVSRAAHSGWDELVFLIGLISVAIGFFNILPVPLLDGGHAAVYIWEGFSGKKPTQDVMATANGVGMAFLLSLLLLATYNDITRIRSEHAAHPKAAPQVQTH